MRLLLACAHPRPTEQDKRAVRELLLAGVDWSIFSRKAIAHGLAGLAGHNLSRLAPDLIPEDIRNALEALVGQTRRNNQRLVDELAGITDQLARAGIKAIAFKGPVLAAQAFGDIGLREFRDLDFLIHDADLDKAVSMLCETGYERLGTLSEDQFRLVHRLQGQEILSKADIGVIEPHTRLTSLKMALDLDYDGLWQRAAFANVFGHNILTFNPEDTLLVLAVHGGKELWWDIKWACDVAHFIASHQCLDWDVVAARAQAQGCYRMLLLATSLVRRYFGVRVPPSYAAAEARDPALKGILSRILDRWHRADPGGPPSNKTPSMDRLRLHDGFIRQSSYVARTVLLPGPQHVPLVALPNSLQWGYIPLGLGHDLLALPLYRAAESMRKQVDLFKDWLVTFPLFTAPIAMEGDKREKLARVHLALKKYRQRVAADPKDCVAWSVMGDVFLALNRFKRAISCYDTALALVPDHNPIWRKRAEAIKAFRKANGTADITEEPQFDPDSANGWAVRAAFLAYRQLYAEAAKASDVALGHDASHEVAARIGIHARLHICDWTKREMDKYYVADAINSGTLVVKPFTHKLLSDSEEDCFLLTQIFAKDYPAPEHAVLPMKQRQHDRIRIAYLSADFGLHPLGAAIVGVLEHHNRTQFEIHAVSFGPVKGSGLGKRVEDAVEHFIDVLPMKDQAVAKMLRNLEIDIAVDLNGLTGQKRPGIFANRAAPVQVNYLGYPGTVAAPFMDYIIADETVIPTDHRRYYSEQVVYLPDAYLPYDTSKKPSPFPVSRLDYGLPEAGFVFASFNNLNKLSPETFSIWMRLLCSVDGSTLWLQDGSNEAKQNLLNEAAARGVEPERLVFAPFEGEIAVHLARLSLADLFLDNLPYNAHSTASDALWAGLPVLTCAGNAFQSRVGASLLKAAGLTELVTSSLEEYEALAMTLAHDPARLKAIREKLAKSRGTSALFDMAALTRNLEILYAKMWKQQQAGSRPQSFRLAEPVV